MIAMVIRIRNAVLMLSGGAFRANYIFS